MRKERALSLALITRLPLGNPNSKVSLSDGPFLKGTATDVPQYCCGGCGHCLIQGVHAKQFVDKSHPLESIGAKIKGIDLPVGDYLISDTVQVLDEKLTLFTECGPLIITCSKCPTTNQMMSPNQLF
jgi:hypothetical protein